jgi:hypothetical protein
VQQELDVRQRRTLDGLDDLSFLRALPAWLASAEDDPRAARVLARLRAEYDSAIAAHEIRRGRERELVAWLHDSAAGSLRRLEWLVDEMAPTPYALHLLAAPAGGALRAALASVRPLLRGALNGRRELSASERRQLGHIVGAARADAARVQDRLA